MPDPYTYNRRITKAFESMDAVKRLDQLGMPTRKALDQFIRGQDLFGVGSRSARALQAEAMIGRPSGVLAAMRVGRTFDLNTPVLRAGDTRYDRRITKAFESMDAVKRLDQLGMPTRKALDQFIRGQDLFGVGSRSARALQAEAMVRGVVPPLSRLRQFPGLQDFVERVKSTSSLLLRRERVEEELAETDPIGAQLSVVLGHVGVGRALRIMELMLSEGRVALLALLSRVLLSPASLEVFSSAVDQAPLSHHVELDLRHALDHLREGDTDRAFPALLIGLEGALRDSARLSGVAKKPRNARSAAAVLKMKKDHQDVISAVYGVANDGRHGEELDRDIGCVLGLVGLVVWMNDCLEQPAVEWLGTQLEQDQLAHAA